MAALSAIVPVILSGGAGSRLWPLSRELTPKQLLPLLGNETMLQDTVRRASRIAGAVAPIVVCNEEHRFLAAEQLRACGADCNPLLLEPIGRNTAPAIAVAALHALARGGEEPPVLVVLPADHVVHNVEEFVQVASFAIDAARAGHLVTFGVVPNRAETGYGYIHAGAGCAGTHGLSVSAFVEKPDALTAEQYVRGRQHYWNSGMFVFRADVYLQELQRLHPAVVDACREAYAKARCDSDFVRLDSAAFAQSPSISVDYAVMEHTERAVVFPLDAGWSDVGAWDAVWNEGEADEHGNVTHGDVMLEGTSASYVHGTHRLVSLVGVHDLIVVDTKDAVLVLDKSRAQDVKNIVARLKREGRSEAFLQRRVERPWGSYEGIDNGVRHQVKRIVVKPGQKLSLQKHHHRAEHWIVVSGTASVTCDSETFLLRENEVTYIPLGSVHRLENPGIVDVVMIEVQTGGYLGEDDIVRLEDNYGRVG